MDLLVVGHPSSTLSVSVPLGSVLGLPISGMLCEYGFAGGWPSIFYTFGAVSLCWTCVWMLVVYDTPQSHPRISHEERQYILRALAEENSDTKDDQPPPTPWLSVLTSIPFWAAVIGHFAGDWGAYAMMLCLPSFMSEVLNFDIAKLGFTASIPYVAYFICINLGGFIADYLRSHNLLSTLNTRRAVMIVALGGQSLFLLAAAHCSCGQETLAVVFMTLGMGLSGLQYAGWIVNYMDIAPPFAGTIMGIGNTISCIAGILPPKLMAYMTNDVPKENLTAAWRNFFYVNTAILLGGTALFCIFAKGEIQSWARPQEKKNYEMRNMMVTDESKQPLNVDA